MLTRFSYSRRALRWDGGTGTSWPLSRGCQRAEGLAVDAHWNRPYKKITYRARVIHSTSRNSLSDSAVDHA